MGGDGELLKDADTLLFDVETERRQVRGMQDGRALGEWVLQELVEEKFWYTSIGRWA